MVQITYQHIKTYLTMRNCGISLEAIQSGSIQTEKDGEPAHNASNLSGPTLETCHVERHCEDGISAISSTEKCNLEINEVPTLPVNGSEVQKLSLTSEGGFTNKRHKVSETKEVNSTKLKATESSVVEWLKNLDEGVSGDLSFLIYVCVYMCVPALLCDYNYKKMCCLLVSGYIERCFGTLQWIQ